MRYLNGRHPIRSAICAALAFAAGLAGQAAPAAAQAAAYPAPALFTGPESRPWAAVGRLTRDGHFVCTATLISETAVLTAAHCVLDDSGTPYEFGRLRFQAGVYGNTALLEREIVGARVHPGYRSAYFADMETTASDVAMLDLGWPVGSHEVWPIPVGNWGGDRRGLLLPSYGPSRGTELVIDPSCGVDAVLGAVLQLFCTPPEGASGAPLVAGVGPERRVIGVLSNRRGGFEPRAFAVRADRALIEIASPPRY